MTLSDLARIALPVAGSMSAYLRYGRYEWPKHAADLSRPTGQIVTGLVLLTSTSSNHGPVVSVSTINQWQVVQRGSSLASPPSRFLVRTHQRARTQLSRRFTDGRIRHRLSVPTEAGPPAPRQIWATIWGLRRRRCWNLGRFLVEPMLSASSVKSSVPDWL